MQTVIESKFAGLEAPSPVSPWNGLNLYFVDINQSPENYLKTIDYVTASSPLLNLVFLHNTDTLFTSPKECFWPQYKLYRDSLKESFSFMTQVQSSIESEELTGFPQQIPVNEGNIPIPSSWTCLTRGKTRKIVIGSIVAKDEELTEANVEVHVAACLEVVRGKFGQDVDTVIYVNKELKRTDESPIKTMTQSFSTPKLTLLTSSSLTGTAVKICFDGGLVVNTPPSGCSICNIPFSSEVTSRGHLETVSHKRNHLYSMYRKDRDTMLKSPHHHGLDLSVAGFNDPDIGMVDDGVVEVVCQPGQTKSFKLVLKNVSPSVGHEEVLQDSGVVVEEVGVLKKSDNMKMSDDYNLCNKDVDAETKIRLKPGKKYKVQINYTATEIGQERIPVMVAFYHETKSPQVGESHRLSRMAIEILAKTHTDEVKTLENVNPFTPQESTIPWRARETIKGKPPPKILDSQDALEVKLPVGQHNMSNNRRKVIATRLERFGPTDGEREEYKKCKEILRKGLTPENYTDYWTFLLHCEQWQEEKDIRYFDMVGVSIRIERSSGLFLMEVPGLAESRPSVLKGDKLYIRESGRGLTEYEGMVYVVKENHVSLGFSDKVIAKVQAGVTWDVRFSFSPFSYDNMHRAVKLANQLPKMLFPSVSNFPSETSVSSLSEYFDDRVRHNPQQLAAVEAIVSQVSGPAPYIVFGPPGTGKTVTLVEAMKQVWQLYPDTHILACAPSNTAADLLTTRLAKHVPAQEMYRLIAQSRQVDSVPDSIRHFSNLTPSGYKFPNMAELAKYRIIITTLVTAGKLASAMFPQDHFQYVFIDEAGQATEPETCIALGGILNSSSGHIVMAGDPYQLGPIVRSPLADKHGLSKSLLERLISSLPYVNPETGVFDNRCVKKLVRNFRSHPALLDLPARLFYSGELEFWAEPSLVKSCLQFPGLNPSAQGNTPLLVHGVTGQDTREAGSPSFFNPEEIFIVVNYAEQLIKAGVDEDDIGIITPYRRQVQKLKWRLSERNMSDIMVGTTEEFQGQERKVIILSTVRSSPEYVSLDRKHKLGFLADAKRFNVSITRSRALLIIVGNPFILSQDKYWKEQLKYSLDLDCYKGVKYPEDEASLGRMEAKYSSLLLSEDMEFARLEEQGFPRKS